MDISTYVAGACTTAGIASLGSCKDSLHAMLTFCRKELIPDSRYHRKSDPAYIKLAPFYVFTCGPEEKGHGHSKEWVKYGTEFAAYIKDNDLGEIVTCGPKLNAKYHPRTTCQTWLWSPDQKAVEAWWEVHKVSVISGRPLHPDSDDMCPRCHEDWGRHNGWTCRDGGTWPE